MAAHGGEQTAAITAVRNFLATATGSQPPRGRAISALWRQFQAALPDILGRLRLDAEEVTYPDLTRILFRWSSARASS